MYRYELDFYLHNCPVEWRHFIYHLRTKSTRPLPRPVLTKALEEYHATKFDREGENRPYVEFETEEDFLAFKLRYL